MATPQEVASHPEIPTPRLEIIYSGELAVGETVEVTADASSMTSADFEAYVHELSQSGEDAKAVLNSLLKVDGLLRDKSLEINHLIANLTTQAIELSRELNEIHKKRHWVKGYIDDR